MSLLKTGARVLFGYVAALEASAAMVRHNERTVAYAAANQRASTLGRKLIVIGDPDAGFHTRMMRAYGCGDVCVDLNGCPRCPVTVVADITQRVESVADDSAVVFVSCVLEYIRDMPAALSEILRMAGSRENVFLVTVQPWTLTARLYPAARWKAAPDSTPTKVNMVPVVLAEKVAATAVVVLLTGLSIWPRSK
mgnify:CR=1 FL=1|jgi:hypothetical protein